MRGAGLAVLILAGVAVVAVAGFFVYLNWAFTPRGPSSGSPSYSWKIHASGPLGPGRFYCIFESRTQGEPDTYYGVAIAADQDTVNKGEGSTILRVTNKPIPVAVRLLDAGTVEVAFDQPVGPSGARQLAVNLSQVESTGWIVIANGAVVD